MEPAVSSTPVTLPSQYLRKGFEDSINLESPPRLNLDAILQAANDGACCTEDNLHSFAAYLNQELITIGFAPVVKDGGSSATCDTVQMLNCVYDLLQQHHQHIQRREDMASRWVHRLASLIRWMMHLSGVAYIGMLVRQFGCAVLNSVFIVSLCS